AARRGWVFQVARKAPPRFEEEPQIPRRPRRPMATLRLIDERPVEHGRLPIRLSRHEYEPGPGSSVRDREPFPRTEQDELRRLRPAPVRAERCVAVQHVGEALEPGGTGVVTWPPSGSSISR